MLFLLLIIAGTVWLPQAIQAEEITSTASVILEMANGQFYNPVSGKMTSTREELLLLISPTTTIPVLSVTSTVPVVVTSTSLIVPTSTPQMFSLREALVRAQDLFPATSSVSVVGYKKPTLTLSAAVWNRRTNEMEMRKVLWPGGKNAVDVEGNVKNLSAFFKLSNEQMILRVHYPIVSRTKTKKGTQYTTAIVTYTPYSSGLLTDEMIRFGKQTLDQFVQDAYADLRTRNIPSRAFLDRSLVDTVDPNLVKAILVIEHIDRVSLQRDPGHMLDIFFAMIGANQEQTYAYAKSSAKARGLAQFIPSTYKNFVKRQELGLIPNFERGTSDPRNVIKAQIAYLDQALADFPDTIRAVYPPQSMVVSEYLAAAYNGGSIRVIRAVKTWGETWSESRSEELKTSQARAKKIKTAIPALKKKITKEKSLITRKTLKKQLGDLQVEQKTVTEKIAVLQRAMLYKETVNYIAKLRQVMPLFKPEFATAVQKPNG